jgi:large subunit ribosomal protein L18
MIKNRLKRRHYRIRKKLIGTPERLRLCVKRSNKHIYAMLIDDTKNRVITTVSTLTKELREKKKSAPKSESPPPPEPKPVEGAARSKAKPEKKKGAKIILSNKILMAKEVGILLANKAKALGFKKVVFDRGGYKYHGRVKAIADGVREAGLEC